MFELIALSALMTLLCVCLHSGGLLLLFFWLERSMPNLFERMGFLRNSILLLQVFAVILTLHLVEIGLWAVLYSRQSFFGDFETALYYSFSAYTTVGYGDLVLPAGWRLVGSLETCVGFLLFGWSTAYFWAVSSRILTERHQQHTAAVQGRK